MAPQGYSARRAVAVRRLAFVSLYAIISSSLAVAMNATQDTSFKPQIHVLQRHLRAGGSKSKGHGVNGSGPKDIFVEFSEVTVEFKLERNSGLEKVVLRLPERQQCEAVDGGRGHKCTGYQFSLDEQDRIQVRRHSKGVLPSGHHINAIDLVSSGQLVRADVNNTVGDGYSTRPVPKRAEVTLKLKPRSGEDPEWTSWHYITLQIKNPPRTPTGFDLLKTTANTFQILMLDGHHQTLAAGSYKAGPIEQVWKCTYTEPLLTSACTAKCGGGQRFWVRKMLHRPPKGYHPDLLENCDEKLMWTEDCNTQPCDVDCEYTDWMDDGGCSVTCGIGYKVQRKIVIQTAVNNGKVCDPWTHADRVQSVPCEMPACEMRRCELAHPAEQAALERSMQCSEYCGGGEKQALIPAVRKDEFANDPDCPKRETIKCNMEACKSFEFFPARADRLPMVNQWYEVVVVFFIPEANVKSGGVTSMSQDMATVIELSAPAGFVLQTHTGSKSHCLLSEHNLPRLEHCKVKNKETRRPETDDKNKQTAVFEFRNPLESKLPGKVKQTPFRVRLWVKHPGDCPGGDDPTGICHGEPGGRTWSLVFRGGIEQEQDVVWEHAGYEIYKEKPQNFGPREAQGEVTAALIETRAESRVAKATRELPRQRPGRPRSVHSQDAAGGPASRPAGNDNDHIVLSTLPGGHLEHWKAKKL